MRASATSPASPASPAFGKTCAQKVVARKFVCPASSLNCRGMKPTHLPLLRYACVAPVLRQGNNASVVLRSRSSAWRMTTWWRRWICACPQRPKRRSTPATRLGCLFHFLGAKAHRIAQSRGGASNVTVWSHESRRAFCDVASPRCGGIGGLHAAAQSLRAGEATGWRLCPTKEALYCLKRVVEGLGGLPDVRATAAPDALSGAGARREWTHGAAEAVFDQQRRYLEKLTRGSRRR